MATQNIDKQFQIKSKTNCNNYKNMTSMSSIKNYTQLLDTHWECHTQ